MIEAMLLHASGQQLLAENAAIHEMAGQAQQVAAERHDLVLAQQAEIDALKNK